MAGMLPSAAAPSLNWLEIGDIPFAVKTWQASRMKKVLSFGGVGIGLLIGTLAGFASNSITSGPGPFSWNFPLFFAVGVPVGLGSFAFNRWFLPRIARASQYQVRRVAISAENLHIEQATGRIVEWPLNGIRVSSDSPAGGWYVVSLPAGRTSLSFWAPPMVASSIRAAVPT